MPSTSAFSGGNRLLVDRLDSEVDFGSIEVMAQGHSSESLNDRGRPSPGRPAAPRPRPGRRRAVLSDSLSEIPGAAGPSGPGPGRSDSGARSESNLKLRLSVTVPRQRVTMTIAGPPAVKEY